MQPRVRVDTRQFTRALRQYMRHTKRDLAEVLNTKGYFIARGATTETDKANREQIESELTQGGRQSVQRFKSGKRKGRTRGGALTGTLAERILRKRYRRAGKDQPTRSDMAGLVRKMINARKRSVGFIKAGWIPAVKQLARFVRSKAGAPRMDYSAKLRPLSKIGGSTAARPGWKPRAEIYNAAVVERSPTGLGALNRVAGRGLSLAFRREIASMRQYIIGKLQKTANRYSARR